MDKILLITMIVFSSVLNLFAEGKLSITVYNSNIGVISDTRTFDIKKGVSEIRVTDVPSQIDPTSVQVKFDGTILEQNYQYDLASLDKILKKYIDKKVRVTGKETNLEGILLSAQGNLVLKDAEGKLMMIPNYNEYKISVDELPEGLITKPTLVWLVDNQKTGKQEVVMTYITNSLDWHAEYVVVLDNTDKNCNVNSWVSLDNQSGAAYKNAELKLIAGDVNRVYGRFSAEGGAGMEINFNTPMAKSRPQVEEREFFEYHIYEVQRPVNLENNETKQISMFDAQSVKITKNYTYNMFAQNDVNVTVNFDNKKSNNLGMPFPEGKVRIFKDDGKSVEFIGEDMIKHTPKDENIKLKIGKAFDIIGETIVKEKTKIGENLFKNVIEIKLKNRKNENVNIEVESNFGGTLWEILKSDIPFEKIDAYKVKFKVDVAKNNEKIFEFTYTSNW
jgi:hypothetical protein